MARKGVTIYDLLISCPGDVQEEIKAINEVVHSFNRTLGEINNIRIEVKHWSTDSFPQSGGKAQELLNKQFINDCDSAIAIFWTRFGTPTDKYQSGTEEEIEDMIKSGKQVFLYFSNRSIEPSALNMEQYTKVKEFKTKYEKESGLSGGYSEINEFKRDFLNHLSLYYLKIITEEAEYTDVKLPKLVIKGISENTISKNLHIEYGEWMKSKFIKDKKDSIIEKIRKIELIKLPELNDEFGKNDILKNNDFKLSSSFKESAVKFSNITSMLPVFEDRIKQFDSDIKTTILSFVDVHQIDLEEKFFYLAGLKESISPRFVNPFSNSEESLIGNHKNKEKYELIKELYLEILEYNEYIDYFFKLSSKGFVKCVISNIGKAFDEDIDVRIKILKGHICKIYELPEPGELVIEEYNKYDLDKLLFKLKRQVFVELYSNYPKHKVYTPSHIPINLYGRSQEDEYKEERETYKENIEDTFCYEFFEDDKFDIITFKIPYLKQNINMAFPSVLVFKESPNNIEYEIRSKNCPEIVSGEIKLIKN